MSFLLSYPHAIHTFNWGDGTQSAVESLAGRNALASKVWKAAGTFQATVMAQNQATGEASGWSKPLTVTVSVPANNPLTILSFTGATSAVQGSSHTYYAYASDPSPTVTAASQDMVRFTFNWGDGTQSTAEFPAGYTAQVSKTWNTVGTFQATVMAQDLVTGAASAWSSPLTVTVAANQPPATPAAPTGPVKGKRKVTYTYSAVTTDPEGEAITYIFDWGDGTTTTTAATPSGQQVTASHAWPGRIHPRVVRVKAIDSLGASSGWSAELVVRIR